MMGPIHGAIVNWCGHKYGYANFDNGDKSKNSTPFDFFMLGELFQNNHHKRPNNANFAAKWFEFDPVYPGNEIYALDTADKVEGSVYVNLSGRIKAKGKRFARCYKKTCKV